MSDEKLDDDEVGGFTQEQMEQVRQMAIDRKAKAERNEADQNRGVYGKFFVQRVDPESQARHKDCFIFILDCTDDPHAIPALRAYAESCRYSYPYLYEDLIMWLNGPRDSNPVRESDTAIDMEQTQ